MNLHHLEQELHLSCHSNFSNLTFFQANSGIPYPKLTVKNSCTTKLFDLSDYCTDDDDDDDDDDNDDGDNDDFELDQNLHRTCV